MILIHLKSVFPLPVSQKCSVQQLCLTATYFLHSLIYTTDGNMSTENTAILNVIHVSVLDIDADQHFLGWRIVYNIIS